MIRPPASRLGPVAPAERTAIIDASDLKDKYTETIDRESAYELLESKAIAREKAAEEAEAEAKKADEEAVKKQKKTSKSKSEAGSKAKKRTRSRKKKSASNVIAYEAKLIARQLVRSQGRRILRGVLGGLMRR